MVALHRPLLLSSRESLNVRLNMFVNFRYSTGTLTSNASTCMCELAIARTKLAEDCTAVSVCLGKRDSVLRLPLNEQVPLWRLTPN